MKNQLIRSAQALGLFAMTAMMAGCAGGLPQLPNSGAPVTQAAPPRAMQKYADTQAALACIRQTGVLKPYTIGVGVFTDSTGQYNAVSPGNTGSLLPQGGSSVILASALQDAGASVIDLYENGTERTARDMLNSPKAKLRVDMMVNGIFTSLDFGTLVDADLQFGGIGPTATHGWAELTLAVQMVQGANKHLLSVGHADRVVRYTSGGVSTGKTFGALLVTGNVAISNQERIQFEALNGPIQLGLVAAIVQQFPKANAACGEMVATLQHGEHLPAEQIQRYLASAE